MASAEYQKRGGGYVGAKSKDNHLQQWTDEKWGTKSGAKSEETGERYLPKEARDHLSASEYKRTSAKKRADTKKGQQFSAQPADVAKKTKPHRDTGKSARSKSSRAKTAPSKADLYAKAKAKNVAGRSKMNAEQLARAVS